MEIKVHHEVEGGGGRGAYPISGGGGGNLREGVVGENADGN